MKNNNYMMQRLKQTPTLQNLVNTQNPIDRKDIKYSPIEFITADSTIQYDSIYDNILNNYIITINNFKQNSMAYYMENHISNKESFIEYMKDSINLTYSNKLNLIYMNDIMSTINLALSSNIINEKIRNILRNLFKGTDNNSLNSIMYFFPGYSCLHNNENYIPVIICDTISKVYNFLFNVFRPLLYEGENIAPLVLNTIHSICGTLATKLSISAYNVLVEYKSFLKQLEF